MENCNDEGMKLYISTLVEGTERYLNPNSINLPRGYQIEVYAVGLNGPNNLIFDEAGFILISESGLGNQNPRVLRLRNGRFELVADGFQTPITGITYYNKILYVAHKGNITAVNPDGTKQTIVTGLPSYGIMAIVMWLFVMMERCILVRVLSLILVS